jgi:nitronate monooxygenase
LNAQKGNLKNGFAFAGDKAYMSNEIISVEALIKTLVEEYNKAFQSSEPEK